MCFECLPEKLKPGVAFGAVRKNSWFRCQAHFYLWSSHLAEIATGVQVKVVKVREEFHCLLRLVSVCCTP